MPTKRQRKSRLASAPVSPETREKLERLFDCADYAEANSHFPNGYDLNDGLSLAPWLPPAVSVWFEDAPQGPDAADEHRRNCWQQVRDRLDELHAEYRAAKRRRAPS